MTVEEGWNENGLKTYKKYKLQEKIYNKIREKTNLQANLVIRAIARGAQAIKGCVERLKQGLKASKPEFTSDSIAYDKRTLSVYPEDRKCTISTINGRIDGEFMLPEELNHYYDKYLNGDWDITQSTIEKHEYEDEKPFYLHLGLEKEGKDEEREDPTVMGVDLGINNLAVTSTGRFFEGDELFDERKRFEKIRGKLQRKGTRSAHLTIKKMSERENRYARDTLHCISKKLVEEAKKKRVDVIAFEELKYIRKKMPNNKRYHVWAFDKLYQYVKYKAKEKGIKVKQVDPRNTSKRCSKCGHIEKSNRHEENFKCKNCGYELHADYNASKNVGIRYLQQRQKSSAGTGHGQLALKSGTLKLNGEYSPTFLGQKWSSLTIYLNSCLVEFNRYLEFSMKILR